MSTVVLCDWHTGVVEDLMAHITGNADKARADVSAALARSCDDCEVTA